MDGSLDLRNRERPLWALPMAKSERCLVRRSLHRVLELIVYQKNRALFLVDWQHGLGGRHPILRARAIIIILKIVLY